jgi:hypothetical protein
MIIAAAGVGETSTPHAPPQVFPDAGRTRGGGPRLGGEAPPTDRIASDFTSGRPEVSWLCARVVPGGTTNPLPSEVPQTLLPASTECAQSCDRKRRFQPSGICRPPAARAANVFRAPWPPPAVPVEDPSTASTTEVTLLVASPPLATRLVALLLDHEWRIPSFSSPAATRSSNVAVWGRFH